MAQITVLTSEAKTVLQGILFREINELERSDSPDALETLDTLHKIYSDVVSTKR